MSKRSKAAKRYKIAVESATIAYRETEKIDQQSKPISDEEVGKPIRGVKSKVSQKVRSTPKRLHTPPLAWRFTDVPILFQRGYNRSDDTPRREGFIWSSTFRCWVKKV